MTRAAAARVPRRVFIVHPPRPAAQTLTRPPPSPYDGTAGRADNPPSSIVGGNGPAVTFSLKTSIDPTGPATSSDLGRVERIWDSWHSPISPWRRATSPGRRGFTKRPWAGG